MMTHQIILTWMTGVEIIDIDFKTPESQNQVEDEIIETYEKLENSNLIAKYKPKIKRTIIDEGKYKGCPQIQIKYDGTYDEKSELPKEIMSQGFSPGTTRLVISQDLTEIKIAKYTSEDDSCTGPAQNKEITPIESIKNEREEELTARLVRDRKFREHLIDVYKRTNDEECCCAITGETLLDALDAAHVHEVWQGGDDSAEFNGIFLRADIHRLFDSRIFTINNNGKIQSNFTDENSPSNYTQIFNNKKEINPSTFKRIRENLKKRNEGVNQK